jgi:hypothetical protein
MVVARIMSMMHVGADALKLVTFAKEDKEVQLASILSAFKETPLISKADLMTSLFSKKGISLFKNSANPTKAIIAFCEKAGLIKITLGTGIYLLNGTFTYNKHPPISYDCLLKKICSSEEYIAHREFLLKSMNLKFDGINEYDDETLRKLKIHWVYDKQSFYNAVYLMEKPIAVGVDIEGNLSVVL